MDVKIKIYFTDNDKQFMGIGVYWLLLRIKKYDSIRKAAKDMNLSYAKALGMLNTLEQSVNKKILNRKRGGDSREGTKLTPEGEKLIHLYKEYQEKIKNYADIEFEKFKIEYNTLD